MGIYYRLVLNKTYVAIKNFAGSTRAIIRFPYFLIFYGTVYGRHNFINNCRKLKKPSHNFNGICITHCIMHFSRTMIAVISVYMFLFDYTFCVVKHCQQFLINRRYFKVEKELRYCSYKEAWQIPKLLVIAHEKMFIARNLQCYKIFTA